MTRDRSLYVPAKRITIPRLTLVLAFAHGYTKLTGEPAGEPGAKNLVEMVASQAGHEMGDDRLTPEDDDYCYNYNLTGLKAGASGPWTVLGTHEVLKIADANGLIKEGLAEDAHFTHKAPVGYKAVYLKPLGPDVSDPGTNFAAFRSLEEGCIASLRKYLVAGQRYATKAIQDALRARQPKAFAYALKGKGYYTADRDEYAGALVTQLRLVDNVSPKVPWAEIFATYGDQLFERLMSDA